MFFFVLLLLHIGACATKRLYGCRSFSKFTWTTIIHALRMYDCLVCVSVSFMQRYCFLLYAAVYFHEDARRL
uniref:Secreted protein n=1 Tax=Aegilops tauschii subsp. strangulata TaxID=200361 RepID=A0A453K5D1_AEGTS